MSRESRLHDAYDAFNARDVDRAIEQMTEDVDWPTAWEGGRLIGRAAVRDYWTRQWAAIDPQVQPMSCATLPDRRVEIEVRQVVRTLDGKIQSEDTVRHCYAFRDDLIARMDVSDAARG